MALFKYAGTTEDLDSSPLRSNFVYATIDSAGSNGVEDTYQDVAQWWVDIPDPAGSGDVKRYRIAAASLIDEDGNVYQIDDIENGIAAATTQVIDDQILRADKWVYKAPYWQQKLEDIERLTCGRDGLVPPQIMVNNLDEAGYPIEGAAAMNEAWNHIAFANAERGSIAFFSTSPISIDLPLTIVDNR